jgi:hypothetical protein
MEFMPTSHCVPSASEFGDEGKQIGSSGKKLTLFLPIQSVKYVDHLYD